MEKTFLISTGGSGGHVVPATILYDHLSEDTNIILTTDKRGLKYFDNSFYEFETIDTPKLNNIFFLPISLIKILFLTFKSFFLLKNKKIEKVFSTGGYMSLPIILAAKFLKLHIYLIEPNQILGRANKYYLNYCKKIFCYTEKVKNFPNNLRSKIIIINPLVKKDIYKFESLKLNKSKILFNILIVGGSQGADVFDQNLKYIILDISKKFPLKIMQQTSESNISSLKNFYNKNNIDNKIFSFDKNFFNNIKEVDLCITRAGASTLAELSILNIPFIAVPLPTSKDNHQFENAKFYRDIDCCWIIDQNYFDEKIDDLLKDILNNKSNYFKKKENLKKLNYQNTWNNVNQKILKSINEN